MMYLGEIAALGTAVCWSLNSYWFAIVGKRVGSYTVTHIRLWMAIGIVLIVHTLLYGIPFPFDAGTMRFVWLGISGVIGYVIGDLVLFEALVLIGARLTMLLMTAAPIFGAILAWIFLGEKLTPLQIAAIVITISGIAWVVGEKHGKERHTKTTLGVICALSGALGQAVGLLFSKFGMTGGFSPISGNMIRLVFGAVAMGILTVVTKRVHQEWKNMHDGHAMKFLLYGTIMGPVVGVILSLVAITKTSVGIASTLMSLSPIILIPLSHFLLHEKITVRATIGTVIALCGVALLFTQTA